MPKEYYIKNMVCDRCIKVLKTEILKKNIKLTAIELGVVQLEIDTKEELEEFKTILKTNGFSLINSAEERLTEHVKIKLIKMIDILPFQLKETLSNYLADKIGMDYSKISKVFSFNEGVTIEKYFIKLKIEKVKELIQSNQYNFTEISQLLDYSNLTHLSNQFKNETGMSLSNYKDTNENFRKSLDEIV